jgi:hypothetical protein
LPPVVAAAEGQHIATLARQWLVDVERPRTPFAVVDTEARRRVSLAGVTLDVTLDRVDRLASGGIAIVDYKTGRASAPSRWFDARPEAPQLALYALAHAQGGGETMVALAYGEVRPGEPRVLGLTGDPGAWPALSDPVAASNGQAADWPAALAMLERGVHDLASAIAAGDARIDPRDYGTCRRCSLQSVCRIRAVRDLAADDGAEGNIDE